MHSALFSSQIDSFLFGLCGVWFTVYPTSVARVWEARISQEFDQQAKKEEQLQIPVAPFMQVGHLVSKLLGLSQIRLD